MQDKRTHLTRTAWTLADQAVVSLGNFLLNVQLARNLPASEYGVFALLFSVIFLFQHCSIALLIYPMSLRVAAARDNREAGLISVTMALVAAGLLGFAILLAASLAIIGRPDIAWPAATACLLWLLQDAMRRGLMAEFRHPTAMIGDAVTYFGQAALVGIVIHQGLLTLPTALWLMAIASLAGGLLQLKTLQLPWPRLEGATTLLREYWQTGRWAVVSGLLMHMRLQLFPWALGFVHGTAATAGFQALMNIANLTNPLVFGLSNTISQSAAEAKSTGGTDKAWRATHFYVLFGAPFIIAYALAVFAFPHLVLQLFYGSQSLYLAYELPLRLIMISIVLSYAADTYSAFLYGTDNGRMAYDIAAVGLVAAVLLSAMIWPWAVTGAALAALCANAARLVPSYRSMATVLQQSPAPAPAASSAGSDSPPRPIVVSIVTPVLNGGPHFAQCLESVMRERKAASRLGIEVQHIVADGGSTDGSVALARSFGVDLVEEPGTDLHERINRAYLGARGELIGFLGADDILLDGGIEAIVGAYRQTGCPWIVGSLRWIDPEGHSLGTIKPPPAWMRPELHACLGWNTCPPMATYFSKSLFVELGGFDVSYHISSDYDLFTRALAHAPFARLTQPIAGSRRSGSNLSSLKKDLILQENQRILEAHGPRSKVLRFSARYLLKAFVNAGHPEWLARKMLDRTQVRLGWKKTRYFD